MRIINIGKLELQLMESPADINDGRYQVVHQLMEQIYSYVERPDPFRFCQLFRKAINENSAAGQLETFFNYEASLTLAQSQDQRVWSLIFALITLENGEDQTDKKTRDMNYLHQKVERYQANGLDAETPEREVQTFFFKCPELLEKWTVMEMAILSMKYLDKSDSSISREQGAIASELLQPLKEKLKNLENN